ncbi:MAG: 2-dehydropantoate 2-reductase [Kiritimatiellae bacterium]|jgi:2-dehydropantoate 2-reductase|nr:2-dehydropantoate 2-reductase [Kiritimatiellia bacterium]
MNFSTVTIFGNGAIGLLLTAFFVRKNINVQIITRTKKAADKINSEGIFLTDLNNQTFNFKDNITATDNSGDLQKTDLCIIITKAYSTEDAVRRNLDYLKSSCILTLQNGLGNVETIQKYLPEQNLIAGTISTGATADGANRTIFCGKGTINIAPICLQENMTATKNISTLLNDCEIRCDVHKDWQTVIWSKLYINAIINPITALYNVKNGEIIKQMFLSQLAKKISDEILQVCKASNINLLFEEPFEKLMKVCVLTSENQSSMLQDVLNHKQLELESITGELIKKADTLGIKIPANQELYEKLKMQVH